MLFNLLILWLALGIIYATVEIIKTANDKLFKLTFATGIQIFIVCTLVGAVVAIWFVTLRAVPWAIGWICAEVRQGFESGSRYSRESR